MKLKIFDLLIDAIYILIFISAFGQLRYQLTLQPMWHSVYLWSLYFIIIFDIVFLCLILKKHRGKVNILVFSFAIFVAYEILVSIINKMIYPGAMVRDILPWPLTLSVIYTYSKEYGIPPHYKYITFFGLAICCILSVPNISRHLIDYGRRGGVIFPLYYCFCFLGVALRVCDKRVNYFFMIVVTILLIVSSKRAGAIIVVVGIILFFFANAHIQGTLKEKRRKYITYSIVLFLTLFLGYRLIDHYDLSILSRLSRIVDDGGSNRRYIWLDVMNHFRSSSLLKKTIGHGFHAVYYKVQPYGYKRMAHNSYLETMYDYGIVGLMFMIGFSLYIFYSTYKMYQKKSINFPPMLYSVVGLIILGLFSYLFEESVIIMAYVVLWGICLGDESRLIASNSNYWRRK